MTNDIIQQLSEAFSKIIITTIRLIVTQREKIIITCQLKILVLRKFLIWTLTAYSPVGHKIKLTITVENNKLNTINSAQEKTVDFLPSQ